MSSKNFDKIRIRNLKQIGGRLFWSLKSGCQEVGLNYNTLRTRIKRNSQSKNPKDKFIIKSDGKEYEIVLIKE